MKNNFLISILFSIGCIYTSSSYAEPVGSRGTCTVAGTDIRFVCCANTDSSKEGKWFRTGQTCADKGTTDASNCSLSGLVSAGSNSRCSITL